MASDESFTLLGIGWFFILARVYHRWNQVGIANFQLDDYLMPLAGVVFTLETVAAYLVGAMFQGLTNSYMTDQQRAALDPNSEEYFNRQWGSKIQVIGWSFYAFIIWAVKFCIAVFYSRLTAGLQHLRLRIRIAYVLLAVTYLAVALTLILSCQPITKFWQINPDPGNLCQPTNSRAYVLVVVIPNVLTDIYLLSIPLPLMWKVNISLKRKLALMLLFSGAVFCIMAGTIRAVVISTSGPEGAVSGSQWACRETFVAIVVANLPILQPLIRQGASKIGLSALFSRTSRAGTSQPLGSGDPSRGYQLNSRRKAPHPLSIPQTNAWGSDEHILGEDQKQAGQTHSKDIVVNQEISISSETVPSVDAAQPRAGAGATVVKGPEKDDWGFDSRKRT
ncbi:hypothetical protein F4779DRAFT_566594 [Xylariaceae sp. FL0662B]|nr:hypothetical protein F4779DRAFT_566594 [Xylariaceae sp. FL0662B]